MRRARTTRRLTCGFVNRLDTSGTLSLPACGVRARAGAVASGRALFITLLALFIIFQISLPSSYGYKNHVMNLKLYAHNEIKDWTEFECYVELIYKESSWNYKARNGSHRGLGQVRSEWYGTLGPRKQIRQHLKYLAHRYPDKAGNPSPCKALRHFYRKGWH